MLQDVQKLTETEKIEWNDACQKVKEAVTEQNRVRLWIAQCHRMSEQDWMEWSTRIEIDGDFILQYYTSHMIGNTIPADCLSLIRKG